MSAELFLRSGKVEPDHIGHHDRSNDLVHLAEGLFHRAQATRESQYLVRLHAGLLFEGSDGVSEVAHADEHGNLETKHRDDHENRQRSPVSWRRLRRRRSLFHRYRIEIVHDRSFVGHLGIRLWISSEHPHPSPKRSGPAYERFNVFRGPLIGSPSRQTSRCVTGQVQRIGKS